MPTWWLPLVRTYVLLPGGLLKTKDCPHYVQNMAETWGFSNINSPIVTEGKPWVSIPSPFQLLLPFWNKSPEPEMCFQIKPQYCLVGQWHSALSASFSWWLSSHILLIILFDCLWTQPLLLKPFSLLLLLLLLLRQPKSETLNWTATK